MLLKVERLCFAYGQVKVLHDVDFEVEKGKITCVIGRNGVGKTTFLKNIMGLLAPSEGRIFFEGEDVTQAPPHRRARQGINLVPQTREIFSELTVEENLKIGLEAKRNGDKAKQGIPESVYKLFPALKEMRKRYGGDLSGGQQQQLAIARALVGEPSLLLLDEPTEGIQPNIIKEIGQVLRRLISSRDLGIVLVEQYLDFVQETADSFVLMSRGRIELRGPATDLSKPKIRKRLSV